MSLLIAAMVLAALPAAAQERTETQAYLGPGNAAYACGRTGAGCFALADDEHVTITVTDNSGRPVTVRYSFLRQIFEAADGAVTGYEALDAGTTCGTVTALVVPEDAARLHVAVHLAPPVDPPGCPASVPTTGTITVAFA